VILTIIGGGLRKYLHAAQSLPKDSLTAMAPISVRAEGEKEALGNLVSAMLVQLGTHIEDPMERLAYVRKEALNSKAMTNAVGARTLTEYSQFIPSGLAGLGARLYSRLGVSNLHSPVFNVVATNVPGPRVPLYFAGAKMVRMMGTGPDFRRHGPDQRDLQLWPGYRDFLHQRPRHDPRSGQLCGGVEGAYEELLGATPKPAPKGRRSAKPEAKVAPAKKAAAKPVKAKAAPKKQATKKPAKARQTQGKGKAKK
jgi:diacylglycerol O-acyltransferase